ncbi:MAG: DUF2970 domain-containing protein [Halofilum sp. (in: g-proteobacteria)]|nr:DUF2970 domain-containing protein [Halofilum sp. (in: g-proteobacteria)]
MNDSRDQRPGVLQIFKSVGAAFFGVQSEANRQRDFTHGRLHHYILAGLVATILFVLAIYGIVQLVLMLAGVK